MTVLCCDSGIVLCCDSGIVVDHRHTPPDGPPRSLTTHAAILNICGGIYACKASGPMKASQSAQNFRAPPIAIAVASPVAQPVATPLYTTSSAAPVAVPVQAVATAAPAPVAPAVDVAKV